MEVRAKKSLGQHFLVDLSVAQRIVAALGGNEDSVSENPSEMQISETGGANTASRFKKPTQEADLRNGTNGTIKSPVLEIGPGMGVLTRYLLQRPDIDLRMVELDGESVQFLMTHFNGMQGRLYQADYLKLDIHKIFPGEYRVIGNFPYNISSQIFFKILDDRDRVPEVVCMVQKEVAERIAEGPGSKTYGILSVLLQAWYDIEYLFTVEPGAFAPPPKVRSAVIRLRRNCRTELVADETPGQAGGDGTVAGGDGVIPGNDRESDGTVVPEAFFRKVVKAAFGQRRKTLRNALKPLLAGAGTTAPGGSAPEGASPQISRSDGAASPGAGSESAGNPVLEKYLGLRAEQLSVEDFISLAAALLP